MRDGCTSECAIEFCGDNLVNNANEQCDDGNTTSGDACTHDCVLETCGDGSVNNGGLEQCDDGNATSGDGCSAQCRIEYCGDGITNNVVEPGDDGNLVSGDGCSYTCDVEPGFECSGEPSLCLAAMPALSGWGMVVLVGGLLIAITIRRQALASEPTDWQRWAPRRASVDSRICFTHAWDPAGTPAVCCLVPPPPQPLRRLRVSP